jgi:hypothetical protein
MSLSESRRKPDSRAQPDRRHLQDLPRPRFGRGVQSQAVNPRCGGWGGTR